MMVMVKMMIRMSEKQPEEHNCKRCGYVWKARISSPKKCPRCGQWIQRTVMESV